MAHLSHSAVLFMGPLMIFSHCCLMGPRGVRQCDRSIYAIPDEVKGAHRCQRDVHVRVTKGVRECENERRKVKSSRSDQTQGIFLRTQIHCSFPIKLGLFYTYKYNNMSLIFKNKSER